MTIAGALAAGLAVGCAIAALDRASAVERRLSWLRVRTPSLSTRSPSAQLTLLKTAGGLAGALAGCAVALVTPLGIVPVAAAAYAGVIAPSIVVERRARATRREAERALVTLVEWLCALVASGRPVEAAVLRLASRGTGSTAMDLGLGRIARDYTLGVTLRDALAREGAASGVRGLVDLAERIDRARDLGRGMLPMLQDLRDDLRNAERSSALQAASQVDTKLTLVLTLCYLPALALLVFVPLFLTLLAGLFA